MEGTPNHRWQQTDLWSAVQSDVLPCRYVGYYPFLSYTICATQLVQ
jgi:hypothetical protein